MKALPVAAVPVDDQLRSRCCSCLRVVKDEDATDCHQCGVVRFCQRCSTAKRHMTEVSEMTPAQRKNYRRKQKKMQQNSSTQTSPNSTSPRAVHDVECTALRTLRKGSSDTSTFRLLLRLLAVRCIAEQDQATMDGYTPFETAATLYHDDIATLYHTDPPRAAFLSAMAEQALNLMPECACDLDSAMRWCSVLQCNSHEVPDITAIVPPGSSNAAGLGLFPAACRYPTLRKKGLQLLLP